MLGWTVVLKMRRKDHGCLQGDRRCDAAGGINRLQDTETGQKGQEN